VGKEQKVNKNVEKNTKSVQKYEEKHKNTKKVFKSEISPFPLH